MSQIFGVLHFFTWESARTPLDDRLQVDPGGGECRRDPEESREGAPGSPHLICPQGRDEYGKA